MRYPGQAADHEPADVLGRSGPGGSAGDELGLAEAGGKGLGRLEALGSH
ncbi:MAG: hypothetical protein ACYCV7_14245 [Acidimicrobiales bacterium]